MAETFQPNAGAALGFSGGQPQFVEDQAFQPTGAAFLAFAAAAPSFVFDQEFQTSGAALLSFTPVQPTFGQATVFVPHEAAFLEFQGGQPEFAIENGAAGYRPRAAALLSLAAAQPSFVMSLPTAQSFIPGRAARLHFSPGQPYFLGGDLLAAAPPILPFRWDGVNPVKESYGYAIGTRRSDDQTEQRRQLASQPSGVLQFRMGHLTAAEAQAARAFLAANQGGKILAPLWQYETRLAQPLAQGALIAWADLVGVPLQATMLVMMWGGHADYQANAILDSDDASALLAYPSAKLWPAGLSLVPLVFGRLEAEEEFEYLDLDLALQEISVTIERWIP